MNAYEQFLTGLRLRHFKPAEFLRLADNVRNGVRNKVPPERLFSNLRPTIWILDLLRDEIGKPIKLVSVYRSPEYNRAVGGASNSLHLMHNAVDFECPELALAYTKLAEWRSVKLFRGGLKKYTTFIHVDTRGENADW